ncbi:hypothetical protein ES708_31884 [subsurface metagenome]
MPESGIGSVSPKITSSLRNSSPNNSEAKFATAALSLSPPAMVALVAIHLKSPLRPPSISLLFNRRTSIPISMPLEPRY